MTSIEPLRDVPLAGFCTMGVGGAARYFLEARRERDLEEAVEWAGRRKVALRVLGGGSNLVVADDGVDGLVVRIALRGTASSVRGEAVELTAAAGEPWDDLVRTAVEQGWAGLECLSGIPGLVGATPIQNVGAYGQEVSDTIASVRGLDRETGRIATLTPPECRFGYRTSALKSGAGARYIVLAVSYRLVRGGRPATHYEDVVTDLERAGVRSPSLEDVRRSVLRIRRSKSMVVEAGDPNRRSCGSFFLNPVVTAERLRAIEERVGRSVAMPRWPDREGRIKLSAAWLIERAGFQRGHREGNAGLSSRHALAIVCHEGARAEDVIALARRVRDAVHERFGVRLEPEPVFWGSLALD